MVKEIHIVYRTPILLGFTAIILSACAAIDGPRSPTFHAEIPDSDAEAIAACKVNYPAAYGSWSPLSGYHRFHGNGAEEVRRCLIEKYGWYQLGKPTYMEQTMAPPKSHK
jgi:hypothetical protein